MPPFGSSKPRLPDVECSNMSSFYTNDAHVTSVDDEVILSLGVRPLPNGEANAPVKRVYMSFFSAKRFLMALQMSVERHEQTFGAVRDQRPSELVVAPSSVAQPSYANFVRVSGSPEELTVEFGINPNPVAPQADNQITVHSQAAMSFATAKCLLQQLSRAVSDYEGRHGVLELDVSKRAL